MGGMAGRRTSTKVLDKAHPLDPDRPVWERQQDESDMAYRAFAEYRDMQARSVRDVSVGGAGTARRWSVQWSWGHRCYQWDLYMARVDEQEMIRYRREMNNRHRRIAQAFQGKVIDWLNSADVTKLRPHEIIRWLEVATKIEREAAGALVLAGDAAPSEDLPTSEAATFGELLGDLGLDDSAMARILHDALTGAAPHDGATRT